MDSPKLRDRAGESRQAHLETLNPDVLLTDQKLANFEAGNDPVLAYTLRYIKSATTTNP